MLRQGRARNRFRLGGTSIIRPTGEPISAFGSKAENICSFRAFPLLTQLGHLGQRCWPRRETRTLRRPRQYRSVGVILNLSAGEQSWKERRVATVDPFA